MDMIGKVRRMKLRDKLSNSAIAKLTGLSRNTVKKWLKAPGDVAPKYRRTSPDGKLSAFKATLETALTADAHRPKHGRRTGKALFEQIQAKGYRGGYSGVTDFIRAWRQESGKPPVKAFVPLSFALGEAFQFDWSDEGLMVGGVFYKVQVAHLKLCASRAFWLVAYPSQGHEMLFDAHTRSFQALGGVTRRGIYDNMKTAVDKVKRGNQQLLRWYQQKGLRRFEWAALKLKQLPPKNEVEEACAKFESVRLRLVETKGGRPQSINVLSELLEQTYEYIVDERAAVVARCKKKKGYVEPEEVFISSTTGKKLNLRSVSNLLRRIFDEAGVEGHGHRIRAFFLQSTGNAEADAEELSVRTSGGRKAGMDWMGVGLRMAEQGRVRHVKSLEPYVGSLRKQHMRAPEQQEYVDLTQAVAALKQERAIEHAKLETATRERKAMEEGLAALVSKTQPRTPAAQHTGTKRGARRHAARTS